MPVLIKGISSMATRQVLAELAAAYERASQATVQFESVGGVDAARRVVAGEPFDVVALASDAIDKLIASGHVLAGSRVDLVRSEVAIAVRKGEPVPDVATEDALRAAVLAAPCVGYSTGPSGTALLKLFERWGIGTQMQARVRQAPPGVPVGTMVARGDVALGFQQTSELMSLDGITIAGQMPDGARITTVFSGGVCAASAYPDEVSSLLAFMAAPGVTEVKRRNGMDAA